MNEPSAYLASSNPRRASSVMTAGAASEQRCVSSRPPRQRHRLLVLCALGFGFGLTSCSLRDYSHLTSGLDETSEESSDESDTSSGEPTSELDGGAEGGADTGTTETTSPDTSSDELDAGDSDAPSTDTGAPDADTTSGDTSSTDTSEPEPVNLIASGTFESGFAGWSSFGNALLQTTTNNPHGGERCLRTSGRTEPWMGPSYRIDAVVEPGKEYQATAWVRVDVPEPTDAGEEFAGVAVRMSTKYKCQDQTDTEASYGAVATNTQVMDTWVQLSGTVYGDHPQSASPCSEEKPLIEYALYFESASSTLDIYVDDVTFIER